MNVCEERDKDVIIHLDRYGVEWDVGRGEGGKE